MSNVLLIQANFDPIEELGGGGSSFVRLWYILISFWLDIDDKLLILMLLCGRSQEPGNKANEKLW